MNPAAQIMRQSRTFGEYLQRRYGEKGTPDREAFEAKATAFYTCEMLKSERENQSATPGQNPSVAVSFAPL